MCCFKFPILSPNIAEAHWKKHVRGFEIPFGETDQGWSPKREVNALVGDC